MSQRPRLAGDGRLKLPAKIAFDHHGFIRGRWSEVTVDPFDWTEDRLLLVESFARLDLGDRAAVKKWWVTHGAVDLIDWTGGFGELPDEHDEWRTVFAKLEASTDRLPRLLLRFVHQGGPTDFVVVPGKAWLEWFGKDEEDAP